MENNLIYVLGGLILVYLVISLYNKRQSRRRKSRSFMEGRRLRDRKERED